MKTKAKYILGFSALVLAVKAAQARPKTIFTPSLPTPKTNSNFLVNPVPVMRMRDCDPSGCGAYGASRGSRVHHGIDVIAYPGNAIKSPITGTVRRLFVYSNSTEMQGYEIKNNEMSVKIFYVKGLLNTGNSVNAGQVLGVAQDIAAYHNAVGKMTPHVHIEVIINGVKVNPTSYFNL